MAPSDSCIQVPTSKLVPSIHELYHLLFHKDEHIMKPFIHKLIPSSSSSTNTDTKKVQQHDVVRNIQIQPWTKKSSSKTTTIEEERRITFQLVNLPVPKLFSSLFSSSSSSSNNNNNNNNTTTTTTKSSIIDKKDVIIDVNMQFQTTTIDATTIQIKCPITFNSTTSSDDDLSFVTFFDVQLEWTLTINQNTMIVNMKSHGRLNHSTANWIPMFQSTIQQFIQKKQKTWIQLAQQQLSLSIPKSSASTTTTTTTTTSNNHNDNDQSDKKQKKSLVMKMMKPFLLSTMNKKKQKDTDEKNNSATNNNDLDDSLIVMMMNAIQAFFSFLWFYLCVVYHFLIYLFHQAQSQFSDVSSTASKHNKNNKQQQQQQLNTGAVVSNGVNKIRKRLFSSS